MRDVAGAGFPPPPPSATPPTAFCSPKGRHFPPQPNEAPHSSKRLPFPQPTGHGELPIRPERHVANSIATMRVRIARDLARRMPRCPCCHRLIQLHIL